MKKALHYIFIISALAAGIYCCLKYPAEIGKSVHDAVDRCFEVMIPSMFIFLCITSYITLSGLHSLLGRPLRILSEKLLRLPCEGLAVFLLSMVSGYPAGMKLVRECREKNEITPQQARLMECFCYSGGPAFISGTAAAYLYPDSNAAALIFISCLSANLITALIMTRTLPKLKSSTAARKSINGSVFIGAVRSASGAMVQMCMMIAAFGGISCMLDLTGLTDLLADISSKLMPWDRETVKSLLMSFLEISNIVTLPTMRAELFPAVTFLLSFGGICVVMQVAALADSSFDLRAFILARLFTALSAGFISSQLMRFLDIEVPCSAQVRVFSESAHAPVPALLLFIMMLMLLVPQRKKV